MEPSLCDVGHGDGLHGLHVPAHQDVAFAAARWGRDARAGEGQNECDGETEPPHVVMCTVTRCARRVSERVGMQLAVERPAAMFVGVLIFGSGESGR